MNTAISGASAGSTVHIKLEGTFTAGTVTGKSSVHAILDFSNVTASPSATLVVNAPASSKITIIGLTSTLAKAIEIAAACAGVVVIKDCFFNYSSSSSNVINDLGSTAKLHITDNFFNSGGTAVKSTNVLTSRMIFENNILKSGMNCLQSTSTALDVSYNNIVG